jgi:cytochrome c biogenesis protein CcmG, thiol:disulfide interchange protein DsbE
MRSPSLREHTIMNGWKHFRLSLRRLLRDLVRVFGASLLLFPALIHADGEKLATLKAGKEIYTNITVTTVTATDIYFTHSHGLGNAKLKSLEPELQKKFHYDAAKASQKEKQQIEAQALYTVELRKVKPVKRAAEAADDERGSAAEVPAHALPARSFLNQPAPTIVGEKWLTDAPDARGKFVLLDFWATWCVPCRRSIPELNALANRFKDRLVVIGLTDEPEEAVRKMTDPKIDYSIAIDTQHRSLSEVGVTAIPHSLLVDPKGIVRFEGHPGNLDEAKLERLMQQYAE